MAASRRKRTPYNPAKPLHDRRATELPKVGRFVVCEVDDPFEIGAKIVAIRSTRNDPLADLHSRRHIDDGQYEGGRAFQRDFEAAERGPRAIDPSKECVDGGLTPEPITEAQRKAALRLKGVYLALGQDGSALVHSILVHGHTYEQVATGRGLSGERWEKFFGMNFRMCLHRLSYVYGFAVEPTGKQRIPI